MSKLRKGSIPIWLALVLAGVIVVMALAISYLVLLYLGILRCVPVEKPAAQATVEATVAPTGEAAAFTPEPAAPTDPNVPADTTAPADTAAPVDTPEPLDTTAPTDTPEPIVTEEPTAEPTKAPTATEKPSSFKFGGKTIKTGTTKINGSSLGINGKSSKLTHIKKEEVQNLVDLCPDLEELTLDYCYMDDYTPLSKLTKLKKLELSRCYNSSKGNAIKDIDWLKSLTALTYLKLRHNKIDDTKAIGELKQLRTLNLGENPLGNEDLTPISKLSHLRTLYAYNWKDLTDVSPIAKLTKLEFLSLGKNSKLESIKSLTGLTNLKELRLYNTKFDDPSYLKDFAQLEKLDLAECPINYKAYFHLENVGTLRHVVLSKKDTDGINAVNAMIAEGYRLDLAYEW